MMKRLSLACLLAGFALHAGAQVPATLDEVWAPVQVATPPSDAYIGLSLLSDGEIRHYNYGEQAEPGTFYLSSRDGGLSWRKVPHARSMPYADRRSPLSGEYLRLANMGAQGVYCIRTEGGIDGDRTLTRVSSTPSIMIKPPLFVRGGRRIVVAAHGGVEPKGCYTYVSDDDGRTWRRSNTVTSPDHAGGGFHRGIRWNHGAVEPTVAELADGRLWMLVRTSQDRHYEAFSDDGGLTWGASRPSRFYGTITMPTLGRLADGRLLLFWCNTTPLPELPTADGVWDDVFTNRDATHVAVSEDDGRTWIGYRELRLDPLRNTSDYARNGGGIDRGMHQAQFVEVAPGKVLASIGQHPLHRALVLFDVGWLYEKERFDDFSDSLAGWSVFNYVRGIEGHCSYNRVAGCRVVSHPEKQGRRVLDLHYEADTTLVSDVRGAVWNFPAMRRGRFSASLRIPEGCERVSLLLNDRWFNPSDSVARYEAMYELPLDRRQLGIGDDAWHEVVLEWDLTRDETPEARIRVDGRLRRRRLPLRNASADGICYAHFIALPTQQQRQPGAGICVERVEARAAE